MRFLRGRWARQPRTTPAASGVMTGIGPEGDMIRDHVSVTCPCVTVKSSKIDRFLHEPMGGGVEQGVKESEGVCKYGRRRAIVVWLVLSGAVPSFPLKYSPRRSGLSSPSSDVLNTMASALRDRSSSAVVPSITADVLDHISIPSFLSAPAGTATWLYTTIAIVFGLLALEQSVYRYKKRHLPGDNWTIPVIGKFADSMKPTMEGYLRQWNSGALSALSVFNM